MYMQTYNHYFRDLVCVGRPPTYNPESALVANATLLPGLENSCGGVIKYI